MKKLIASFKRNNEWLKGNRHKPVKELIGLVNQELRGHYAYYGITFNGKSLYAFRREMEKLLFKWLNRRSRAPCYNWVRFTKLILEWMPLAKPRIVHSYLLAKP